MSVAVKNKNAGLVRILFGLGTNAWHGFATERVWAMPVSGNRYRIRNSPFYAYGVSAEDIVFAEPAVDGTLIFSGVSIRGGHSTYRLFTKADINSEAFNRNWQPLQSLGCSFEQATEHYLAVDIPPSLAIDEAYALLAAGEVANTWEFEEGHCGQISKP